MLRARILLLALLAALAAIASSSAQTPRISRQEREALIAFYHSTHGEEWTDNTGWLGPPGTECKWVGLSCTCLSAPTGCLEVYAIELPSNNLRGSLTRKLADLRQLRILDLSLNRLRGPLPRELGTLRHMQFMNFAGNEFEGEIPPELGNLRQLEWLDLRSNRLGPTLPEKLSSLKRLQVLGLSENRFIGTIPRWLGSLTRLVALTLGHNDFSGEIPAEIFDLPELTDIGLEENHLSGRIPQEIGDHDLHAAYLQGNRLTGPIPETITRLPFLSFINVDWNALYPTSAEIEKFIADRGGHIVWVATQTLAPTSLSATPVGATAVRLTWEPVSIRPGLPNEPGGYEVHVKPASAARFRLAQTVPDKRTRSMEVGFLEPATTYVFRIRTYSNRHEENQNLVRSEFSEKVTATTLEE